MILLYNGQRILILITIGEEVNKVNNEVKLKYTDIPWELISARSNKIVHNYDAIDISVLWEQ